MSISHSSRQFEEETTDLIESSKLKIGLHCYESRFVVADTRYDVILGTPWHKDVSPTADYDANSIRIADILIRGELPENNSSTAINNITLKQCQRMLRKKGTSLFAVVLNSIENHEKDFGLAPKDPEMKKIVEQFSDVFQSSLPQGLPPIRSVDHEIETEPGGKYHIEDFLSCLLMN